VVRANVLWIVAAAFTVSVVPPLILVSYIVRIAIVAKRTLAIGPLILRESQRYVLFSLYHPAELTY